VPSFIWPRLSLRIGPRAAEMVTGFDGSFLIVLQETIIGLIQEIANMRIAALSPSHVAVVVAIVCAGSWEMTSSGAQRAAISPNYVRLEMTLLRGKSAVPSLRVSIVNESRHLFWVNKRFLWNGSTPSPLVGELRIEVRDSAGQSLPFNCKMRISKASVFDYVVLHPGSLVGRNIELDDPPCLKFERGPYSATAYYRDAGPFPGLGASTLCSTRS
jgi:hypothetical protein